jgi:endoglucanase
LTKNIGAKEEIMDNKELKDTAVEDTAKIKTYAEKELLKQDIIRLCSIPSLSGFEYRASDRVRQIYGEYFDEIKTDLVGNQMLIRRCGRADAPRILVDAHFDEVGMIVSDVLEGGFLRMVRVGGIDPAIMQAADVIVCGNETLRGVVISTPPHLRAGNDGKLPPVEELLVDVGLGYTLEELRELVPLGSPIVYAAAYSELGEKYIAGKSFDDKACGAIAARAIIDTPREELAGDVYLCFSAREETSAHGGALSATFKAEPDYALVIDVNLGSAPDVPSNETVKMGGGVSVSYSAATHRGLTEMTVELYRECAIPVIPTAAPSSTGTNAPVVNLVRNGIPTVDIGLPLRNMHTYNEVINLDDCNALCGAVREFICSGKIADSFGKEEIL